MKNFVIVFVITLSFVGTSTAQWSSDPSVNLTVCDTTGEQALSKIGSTSDGGCIFPGLILDRGTMKFIFSGLILKDINSGEKMDC